MVVSPKYSSVRSVKSKVSLAYENSKIGDWVTEYVDSVQMPTNFSISRFKVPFSVLKS